MMDIEKPNCIGCHHVHPDNGNCIAVGGFCTAVPAAHCPLIPELQAENEKLRYELEQVKRERDAAVNAIRTWRFCESCKFGGTPMNYDCLGCYRASKWEWNGQKEDDNA